MKSYQVQEICIPAEQPYYSDLKVLKSAAGYYIGTEYHSVYGTTPGSRDSDYYPTEEKAKYALLCLENLDRLWSKDLSPRDIAATWARQMHILNCDPRQVGYRFYP